MNNLPTQEQISKWDDEHLLRTIRAVERGGDISLGDETQEDVDIYMMSLYSEKEIKNL